MPKRGGEGPKGFTWHNPRPPEEIVKHNAEIGAERWNERAEANRKKLLEGIDEGIIATTREKAGRVLTHITEHDQVIAEGRIDEMVRTRHPKELISILHSQPEHVKGERTVEIAAIAMAFLALTEETN